VVLSDWTAERPGSKIMGPSPLQILLVIVTALLLFGAGRISDGVVALRSRRSSEPRTKKEPS